MAQPHFKYELSLTPSGHFYNCSALQQVKSARRLAPKLQLLRIVVCVFGGGV